MSERTPFWIQCVTLGTWHPLDCWSEIRVWRGKDPRYVAFKGDAYWMWMDESPYRARRKGFCWAQALHDGLIGPHATILHSGHDRFIVMPEHEDFAHVARMWELAQTVGVPEGF